ncbi:AAA family ATPase [Halomonas sp. MCCC 1A11062]|uniref:AAA family ATPase n=1 Tax=Halomonas sp. MCCC 1A11062 TaxID=2733485 RepID=UPI001F3E7AC9|nr:AAA family ATPase [Halomonas sp. MCCC 1A11062]MCE8039279.1 AAA domain-containing protein [Halomonas sp. MCCC 1A11062]
MTFTATPCQARLIVETQLNLLWSSLCSPFQVAPIMLWGQPGIGKSQLIRELCQSLEIEFLDVRLSQMEPVDMRGIPVPDGESVKWLVASSWPRDQKSKGILLFDELSAADRSLQVAAYELLLDRRLGDLYELPDGWLVMGAGNRFEDRAVSVPMSSALANRLLHVEIEADIEAWSGYAVAKGLHPDVVAFLRFKPEYLLVNDSNAQRGWPSPRSWERVATLLMAGVELDAITEQLMISGLVGESACTEFMAFRELANQHIDIPAMLRGDVPVSIPNRIDQQLAFVAAVVHYLWQGSTTQQDQRISVFFAIGAQLTSDLATLMLMDALRVDNGTDADSRAEQVFGHPGFERWLELHGVAMDQITPVPNTGLPEGRFTIASARVASQKGVYGASGAEGGQG